MPAHDGVWRKSSFHQPTKRGDCVLVYQYGDGAIGLTDERFPTDLAKIFSPEAWSAFVAGVKAGEFDFDGPETAPALLTPAEGLCLRAATTALDAGRTVGPNTVLVLVGTLRRLAGLMGTPVGGTGTAGVNRG